MSNTSINFLHLIQNNPVSANIHDNIAKLKQQFKSVWQTNPDTLIITPALATSGRIISDRIDLHSMQTHLEQEVQSIIDFMPEQAALLLGTPFMCDDFFKPVFLLIQNKKYQIYDYQISNPANTILKIKDKSILLIAENQLQDAEFIYDLPKDEVDFACIFGNTFYTHTYMDTLEENNFNYSSPLAENKEDEDEDELWHLGYHETFIQNAMQELMQDRTKYGFIYLNLAGATDGYINKGCSFYANTICDYITEANLFTADSLNIDLNNSCAIAEIKNSQLSNLEYLRQALITGIKDYVEKNRFTGVVLGISGGIDSALVAALALEALGKDRVHGYILPFKYTSQLSIDTAEELIKNLGIQGQTIRLDNLMQALSKDLNIDENTPSMAWQNAQARSRALLMMTKANENNWLLLSTGNKSEASMGYATLYGDMAGGFAPIKDLYKTQVYALSKYMRSQGVGIPEQIIARAPTAELADNQKDEDNLPAYEILDQILYYYLDEKVRLSDLLAMDFDEKLVQEILKTYNLYEFKRRQAAPGIELNSLPDSFVTSKVINNAFCK